MSADQPNSKTEEWEKHLEREWQEIYSRDIELEKKRDAARDCLRAQDVYKVYESALKRAQKALDELKALEEKEIQGPDGEEVRKKDIKRLFLNTIVTWQAHADVIKARYEQRIAQIAETLEEAASRLPTNKYNMRESLRSYARYLTDPQTDLLANTLLIIGIQPEYNKEIPMFTTQDMAEARSRGFEEGYEKRAAAEKTDTLGRIDHIDLD
jgi:hypothetical protein